MSRHHPVRSTLPGSLPLLASALMLVACSGGEAAPSTAIATASELDAPDRAIDVQASELYRLGGFSAEGWEQFGHVNTVAFDDAGNLYIMDSQAMQVTVVGRSGERVRTFGRPGGGPGEFGSPLGMAVFRDGTTVVSDVGNRGFSIFGGDGSFQRHVPFDGLNFAGAIVPFPPNRVLQVGGGIRVALRGPGGAPPAPTTRPVNSFSLESGAPTSEWEGWLMPPLDVPEGPSRTMVGPSGQITLGGMLPLRAFEPQLHVHALPDGRLVTADSVGYRVRVLRDGAVERVLERPIAAMRATPAIQEAERERRLAALGSGATRVMGGGAAASFDLSSMERDRIRDMVFADEVPVINRLATDWQGRIWVERAAAVPGEPGPVDLLTPEGAYLGTIAATGVRIPVAFGPDGLMAYMTRDEYDVAVVEVKQLAPEWR